MSPSSALDMESGELEPAAEINVTPLVDVMLVLLIIFMVTAPMLTAGLNVELPQASTAKPTDPLSPIVVTMTAEGLVTVGAEEIPRSDVVAAVRRQMGDEQRTVHVRGDRSVAYGEVVALLDQLALNGITRLSLISRQEAPQP